MTNYLINYKRMVEHLVPPLLRKSKMLAWIRVFSSVFSNHNSGQGLEGIFLRDRLTTNEDKSLFGLNLIFQAPVEEEKRRYILSEALGATGTDGIGSDLVNRLLEIGREVSQLSSLEQLNERYEITSEVIEELVNRLSSTDYLSVFSLDNNGPLPNIDDDLEFKIADYPNQVNDLSFERFRRLQLYNVLLTGQTIVLETHLNTLFGLYKFENGFYDLKRDDQKIRIENETANEYTYFHKEEAIYPNFLTPGLDHPQVEVGNVNSLVLYCQEEPIDPVTVISPLIITGIIAGERERGIPQAIEFFAINEVDLSSFKLRATADFDTDFETGEQEFDDTIRSIVLDFPSTIIPAKSHFYLNLDSNIDENGQLDSGEVTNFERFFGYAPGISTNEFNLNRSAALELIQVEADVETVVDIFGDPSRRGEEELWRYRRTWVYRKTDSLPLDNRFISFDWRFVGAFPFKASNELEGISIERPEGLLTNFNEENKVDNPFPAGDFDLQDLAMENRDEYLGCKTETNQGAGFDFKVICPSFTDENRPFKNTPEGANDFLNRMVAEINKFRLAGKFFIIEAEGSKLSAGSDNRLFEERFEVKFE